MFAIKADVVERMDAVLDLEASVEEYIFWSAQVDWFSLDGTQGRTLDEIEAIDFRLHALYEYMHVLSETMGLHKEFGAFMHRKTISYKDLFAQAVKSAVKMERDERKYSCTKRAEHKAAEKAALDFYENN